MRITETYSRTAAYGYKKDKKPEKSFGEALAAAEKAKSSDSFCRSNKKPASEMTDAEYEYYIYERVSGMQKNSSRDKDCFPVISKEGLAAMKSDPTYEKWVLDNIRSALSSGYSSRGGGMTHSVFFVGASREECRYESWNSKDFSGPSAEELKRFRAERKAKAEKMRRYRKVLEENSLKRADKEREHIRGKRNDMLYEQKNVCAMLTTKKYYV